ncbi:secreted protein containing von Willebrand factor, type A [Candidatus Magnetobacterium bavaricum]|uniref:Secreted protein containing von Willebrand factor, type A n=1 Tax=Candidatus Magnetobacterium bavaricum TaxID=29290 RepID=A0A0F3H0B4_9BACT|nr:secreted protein containing von Willebrand factor, type A [Candidatus Magnetobacterium bavaricum]
MRKAITVLIMAVVFVMYHFQGAESNSNVQQKDVAIEKPKQKLDVIIVLDNSGSMKKSDPNFLTRDVVMNFLNGMSESSRMGMVVFDKDVRLMEPLTDVSGVETKTKFLRSLDSVSYKGQLTNTPAAIESAIYELKSHGRPDTVLVIILLTDGIVETGDKSRDMEKEKWLKEDLTNDSKKAGIRIMGVAFTNDADFSLIQTLAIKTDGEYYRAFKAEDIQGVFTNIKQKIMTPSDVNTPQPTKTVDAVKVETPPEAKSSGIPVSVIIAGVIIIGGIIGLVFFLRRKKTHKEKEHPLIKSQKEHPLIQAQAELIDINRVVFKEHLHIKKSVVSIGRGDNSDIVIPKDTMSGEHATIEYKDGHFYLEDLRSSNGTKLNNIKIEPNKPMRLKSGDEIIFDTYKFRFQIPAKYPSGGTVLRNNSAKSGSTVLRPIKGTDGHPATPEKKSEEKQSEIKSAANQTFKQGQEQSVGEKVTALKSTCFNHESRNATGLCEECHKAFCGICMTEKDERDLCKECANKS